MRSFHRSVLPDREWIEPPLSIPVSLRRSRPILSISSRLFESTETIASKIPNYKFPAYRQALNLAWYRAGRQIPNKLQYPISNDQTDFVSNLCDPNLFEIWCLGFGASIQVCTLRYALCVLVRFPPLRVPGFFFP